MAHFALLDRIVYVVQRPAMVRDILAAGEDQFIKWSGSRATKLLFGGGVLSTEGERHRQMRRAASPALHQTRLAEYAIKIGEITERRMQRWPANEPFDLAHEFSLLTLEAVSEALFHTPLRHGQELIDAVATMQRFHESFGTAPDDDRLFHQANARIDATVREMLEERAQAEANEDDLLALILATVDDPTSREISEETVQEARSFYLAGHVTTSLILAATLSLLTENPAAQTRLQSEIDRTLDDNAPQFSDLPQFSFLEHALLETLRLYPPVWMLGREAIQPFETGGFHFPQGAQIVTLPWLTHRDARNFSKPEKFQPQRWENDARARLPRGVYIPFSAGPRNCIGERFALMEATLVLARVLQRWSFTAAPGHSLRWERHATLCLPDGVWLRATPRDQARASKQ